MLSLAVTTSTSVVGVAIGDVQPSGSSAPLVSEPIAEHLTTDRRHAEVITPLIADVAGRAGVALADLELLVVDIGPGRFTGLRVGLATVKSLAFALSLPVVGLTSLEILAAGEPGRPLLVSIDARRAEVFQQVFGAAGEVGQAVVGKPDELLATATAADDSESWTIVGDGADRYPEVYGLAVRAGCHPSAETMLSLASPDNAMPGPSVQPLYLRDPDVQINIKTRHTQQ